MTERARRWALIIHGGAKKIAARDHEENRTALAEALEEGRAALAGGGTALDGCEAAVRALERLPVFNAGYGSVLNELGEVEMDASIMDGRTLDVGAVAAVMGVRHPVSVARSLLAERAVLLAGDGALKFARDVGAELCAPEEMITKRAARETADEHDTVGAVAMDVQGNLAVATSTGGLPGKRKGRVGDSPLPGCGYYADNELGALSFSGHGESIVRLALAMRIIDQIEPEGVDTAIRNALERMSRVGGEAGVIAIDRHGRIGWAHNSPHFAVASVGEGEEPRIWLSREELDQA